MDRKLIKGCIIHTPSKDDFQIHENAYIYVEDGLCQWIKKEIDQDINKLVKRGDIAFKDYGYQLIIPSFIDLHLHAPQYIQMGVGLNLPLIDWLNQYTFKIEERFIDGNYARKSYPTFVRELYDNGTLRSVMFGTIHRESNEILVKELSKLGLCALVGKVNMNRFTTLNLTETVEGSLKDTRAFIDGLNKADNPLIKPIITPRFAPSCTGELMEGLGRIVEETKVPIQSHLCETLREIEWVKDLFKDDLVEGKNTYSDVYLKYGLFGHQPTVMAHGIYMEDRELDLVRTRDIWIAHCPTSNMNLTSGIMPLARYLDLGLKVGLGSDIGAGHTLAMNQVIISAIQNAKLKHVQDGDRELKDSEAFYIATKGNGQYLEKVFNKSIGDFSPGASFDALVIGEKHPIKGSLTPLEQLQRFLYCGDKHSIKARYLEGVSL